MNYNNYDEDGYPIADEHDDEWLEIAALERIDRQIEEAHRKQQQALDGLAMVCGLSEACREKRCPWFYEAAEAFLNKDNQVSVEQMDYLRISCAGCKGKETGEVDPVHDDRLTKEWNERLDWIKWLGIKQYWHCQLCPNVYRVYGQYKDPDDEWKAIEDLCCDCKYFQEE